MPKACKTALREVVRNARGCSFIEVITSMQWHGVVDMRDRVFVDCGGLLFLGAPDYDTPGRSIIGPYTVLLSGRYRDQCIMPFTFALFVQVAGGNGLELVD